MSNVLKPKSAKLALNLDLDRLKGVISQLRETCPFKVIVPTCQPCLAGGEEERMNEGRTGTGPLRRKFVFRRGDRGPGGWRRGFCLMPSRQGWDGTVGHRWPPHKG